MYEWIDPQFLRQRREDLIREVETHRPMKMLRIQHKEHARLSRECAHYRRDNPVEEEKVGNGQSKRSPGSFKQLRGSPKHASGPDPISAAAKGCLRSWPGNLLGQLVAAMVARFTSLTTRWRRVRSQCGSTSNQAAATLEARHGH